MQPRDIAGNDRQGQQVRPDVVTDQGAKRYPAHFSPRTRRILERVEAHKASGAELAAEIRAAWGDWPADEETARTEPVPMAELVSGGRRP